MADNRGGREAVENAAPGQGGRKTSMTVAEARMQGATTEAVLKKAGAYGLAACVLGRAAHPNALNRLFQLWPEAVVRVEHSRPGESTWDGKPNRWSRVTIYRDQAAFDCGATWRDEDGTVVTREAKCHPADNWDRRRGIALAFNRALKAVPR